MVDIINYEEQAEPIQYNNVVDRNSNYNAEYEMTMQQLAGIEPSTDFQAVRDSLAQQQINESKEWDLKMAEYGLSTGNLDVATATKLVNYSYQLDPSHSLERAVARRNVEIGVASNPDQAANEYVDADGATEEYSKKAIRLQQFYKNLHDYSDNTQGFFGDTADFIKSAFLPGTAQFAKMSQYSPTLTGGEADLTHHALADTIRNNLLKSYDEMSSDDFSKWMDTIEGEIYAHNPNRIMLDDYILAADYGGSTLLDVAAAADLLPVVGGIVKTGMKLFSKNAGRKLAKDIIKNSGSNIEKLDTVLETAAKPVSQQTPGSTFNSYASDGIADEVFDITKQDFLASNLEKAEEDALLDVLKTEVYDTFKLSKNEPLDAVINYDDAGKVSVTYNIDVGSNTRMTQLQKEFEEAGVDAQVVQRDGIGNYLQFTQEIDPDDANRFIYLVNNPLQWIPLGESKIGKVFQAPLSFIGKHFAGSTVGSDTAHMKDIVSSRIHNRLLSKYADYKKVYNGLDKQQKDLLKDIVHKGNVDSVWYNEEYLRKAGLDDDGIASYNNYRKIEDINYVFKNMLARRDLTQRGYKLYAGKYVGKKVPLTASALERASIMDEAGNLISKKQILGNEDKYTLIALDSINDTDATHLAIRKSSELVEGDLPGIMLPYRAGGRREYLEGTQFIRVLGDVIDADGTIVGRRARTIATANSAIEGNKMAAEINSVIKLLKEIGTSPEAMLEGNRRLTDLNLKHFRVTSWEQVKELQEKGVLSANGQAQSMLDGKRFIIDKGEEVLEAEDWSSEMAMMNSRFNQHRGNILEDIMGQQAGIYSIDEMFNKAVRKAAALGARGDLMLWYKKGLRQFAEVLENPSELLNMNASSAIRNARLIPVGDIGSSALKTKYRAAENFLKHARAMANVRTPGEEAVQRALDNIAYQLIKYDNVALKKLGGAIMRVDPVRLAQHVVFNKVMGWYNPAQLIKQSLGTAAALSLEPQNAPKVLAALPLVMTTALTKEPAMYKRLAKALDISVDDVKDMFKYMEKFGTKESAGLLTGAEQLALSAADWLMTHQYDFMRWGNAINYYAADMLAYLAKKNKGYNEIAAYADDLFINMTRASNAGIQRGLTAPLTQWLTYPMRMFETMFNRRLTKAQKLQLLGSQIALYGPAGVLGGNVGQIIYGWEDMSPEVKSLLSDGLAGLTAEITGVDFREGPRVLEVPAKFLKMLDPEAGVNVKTIAAAAGWGYIRDMSSTIYDLTIRVPFTDMEFVDAAYKMATNKNLASSFKNVARTTIAMKYNKLINHKGITVSDPSTSQIIGQLLGYQPNEMYHQRMVDVLTMNQKELVDEHVGELDDIISRIQRYELEDAEKYLQDENYKRLLNEFTSRVRLLETALMDATGNGSNALNMFTTSVLKKVAGLEDLSDKAIEKALKNLNNSTQALIVEIFRRDK